MRDKEVDKENEEEKSDEEDNFVPAADQQLGNNNSSGVSFTIVESSPSPNKRKATTYKSINNATEKTEFYTTVSGTKNTDTKKIFNTKNSNIHTQEYVVRRW